MRTAQELFDTVVTHLRKQGKKSEARDGLLHTCLYRTKDHLMCAIGCLIPDEEYSSTMESNDLYNLIEEHFLTDERRAEFMENDSLLARLQSIHDELYPSDWEEVFRKTAINFNLVYTAP